MRKATTLVLAGTLGLGGLVGGLVAAPAIAAAATGEQSAVAAMGDRISRISAALQGLVDDGTLTDAQRDRVATTLDEALPQRGHGRGFGHGPGFAVDAAAEALGVTEDELRTELRDGQSLADVAEQEGVALDTLTDALVAAAQERLDAAVADGRLTQEQADARKAELAERIGALVQREGLPARGRPHGD